MKIGESIEERLVVYVCALCKAPIEEGGLCCYGCEYDAVPSSERPQIRQTLKRVDTLLEETTI